MIILGSGCSFTHAPKERPTDKGWLYWLEDMGYEVYNYAQGSGGNQMSTRSLIYAMSNYHKDEEFVVIRQITSAHRNSFLVSEGDKWYDKKLYEKIKLKSPDFWTDEERYSYQTSFYGFGKFTKKPYTEHNYWRKVHSTVPEDKLAQLYYEHFGNKLQCLYETLESILYLQSYCDSRNIPHLQFFGWDTFRLYMMELRSEECQTLIAEIDWDKIITLEYDSGWVYDGKYNKDIRKYGGIHEYALMNLPEEDWFCDEDYVAQRFGHPHGRAHKSFAKNILHKRLLERYL